MKKIYGMVALWIFSQAAFSETFYTVCKKLENQLNSESREGEGSYIRSFRILRKATGFTDCYQAHNVLLHTSELNLGDTEMDNLRPLGSLPAPGSLVSLDLSNTEVSDLTPLSHLISLRQLFLFNTNVSEAETLSHMSWLSVLDLGETMVADISFLQRNSMLTWLNLGSSQVTSVRPLAFSSRLTYLDVSDCEIHDIQSLKALSSLRINTDASVILESE